MSCQIVPKMDISNPFIQVSFYLDKNDVVSCCRVSAAWRKLAGDNAIWSRFYPGAELPKLYGVTLKEHLYDVFKMFSPVKFPDIWSKIYAAPVKTESAFNDDKASFVDELSQDGNVSMAEGQTWDLMEITDECAIEYPSRPSKGKLLTNYLLSFFIRAKN